MNNETTPIVRFSKADISNGENVVVHSLDMTVQAGELVYITGRVGSGKSSIVHTITAEVPLDGGEGEVCGYNLCKLRRRDIPQLRRNMGVVFQDFQLLMDRSAEENLAFVLKSTGWKDRAKIDERIEEVLKAVGMTTKAHKFPHQLSGGEQQRICIARAILNKPKLVVADEPTGNLDNETADQIMELLQEINKEGTAIIMVTHRDALLEKYPGREFRCDDESCREVSK